MAKRTHALMPRYSVASRCAKPLRSYFEKDAQQRRALDNSSTLYFADGANLYTLSTTTGGSNANWKHGSPGDGAMLLKGGFLYGGQNTSGLFVDTLDNTTGSATIGPSVTGTSSAFFCTGS